MIGIDKAPSAIKLATEISHQECAKIKLEVTACSTSPYLSSKHYFVSIFKVCDVLKSVKEGSPLNQKYKLILDKGLFDSASSEVKDAEEFREKYTKNIQDLLLPGGTLLMATCSYTEEEVKSYLKQGWWTFILSGKLKNGISNIYYLCFYRVQSTCRSPDSSV